MTYLELMKKAQDEKNIKVIFDVLGVSVMLSGINLLEIQEKMSILKLKKIEEYSRDGLDKMPINDIAWAHYLAKRKAALQKNGKTKNEIEDIIRSEDRPANEAERLASEYATIFSAQQIIPLYLRDPKTGKYLFDTDADKKAFIDLVKADIGIVTLIASKFSELTTLDANMADDIKNV